MKCAIVANAGEAPEALLAGVTLGEQGDPWRGKFQRLRAFGRIGAMIGERAIFCGVLSERWGCLVACTPEFAAWWLPRAGRPPIAFFLEVLTP